MSFLDRILRRRLTPAPAPAPAVPRRRETRHVPGRPIRLTRRRALALIAIAEAGLETVEQDIRDLIAAGTAETAARARAADQARAHAADALLIIRDRYTHPDDTPTDPTALQLDLDDRSTP